MLRDTVLASLKAAISPKDNRRQIKPGHIVHRYGFAQRILRAGAPNFAFIAQRFKLGFQRAGNHEPERQEEFR